MLLQVLFLWCLFQTFVAEDLNEKPRPAIQQDDLWTAKRHSGLFCKPPFHVLAVCRPPYAKRLCWPPYCRPPYIPPWQYHLRKFGKKKICRPPCYPDKPFDPFYRPPGK